MDDIRDERPGLFGIGLGELRQQVQQRQTAGGELLGAVVRIEFHRPEQAGRIDGGEAREFEGGAGTGIEGGRSAGGEFLLPDHDGLRIRMDDLDVDGFDGLAGTAGRGDGHLGGTFAGSLEVKADEFVTCLGEVRRGGGVALDLEGAFGLDRDLGVLDAVVKREDIDGQDHAVAGADLGRQGHQDHERGFHRDGLVGIAVGAVVSGDDHHAEAAHVHRQGDIVLVRALVEGERAHELHHRVEAVVLAGRADVLLVTAHGQHRAEPAGIGAHDLVIQIPGLHAQGLGTVHGLPRGRGLEGGQVQQALVHDGEGVGHRLAGLLGHLDGELLLRGHGVGHLDDRLQVRARILHVQALHAVQAQRKVVGGVGVRLDEGDMDIEVRGHLRGDGEGVRGVLAVGGGDPFAGDDAGAVLEGDERLSALGGRDVDGGLVTGAVAFLVGGEGEHRQGVRILAVGAAAVSGPVDDDGLAGDVSARDVTYDDEVAAPVGLGGAEGEGGVLRAGGKRTGRDRLRAASAHIALEAGRIAFPPPAPIELEHGVFQLTAGEAVAGSIDNGDADGVVLIGFQFAVRGEFHAHVGRERGVGDGLGGEALVTAAFQDGRDDEGLQHAGSVLRGREVEGGLRLAVAREGGVEELMLAGLEGGGRVAEDIAFEALEGGRTLGEGHRRMGLEAGGRDAREPGGRDVGRCPGAAREYAAGQVQVHLQAVGLHGLDVEAFMESGAAHLDIGVPPAGGILGRSGDREGVETVLARGNHPRIELSFRSIEFQGGRVALRDALHLVGEDHRHVEGVAGTPDAALTVDEALEALLDACGPP